MAAAIASPLYTVRAGAGSETCSNHVELGTSSEVERSHTGIRDRTVVAAEMGRERAGVTREQETVVVHARSAHREQILSVIGREWTLGTETNRARGRLHRHPDTENLKQNDTRIDAVTR